MSFEETIAQLKATQDKATEREQKFAEVFVPFRNYFFQHLGQFLEDATGAGLRKIQKLEYTQKGPEIFEAKFTINGFPLVIIAPNRFHLLAADSKRFGSKIFIYDQTDFPDTQSPFLEIVVVSEPPSYAINAFMRNSETLKRSINPITHGTREILDASAAAFEAINYLVDFFYSMTLFFREQPTLSQMRGPEEQRRDMGFLSVGRSTS